LIEGCGFTKAKDWYAWWFADPSKAATHLRRLAMRLKTRLPVTFRPADLKNLREESGRLRQIFNQAWEKNWGFVPFTEAEIEFMTEELKPLIVPEFAWNRGDRTLSLSDSRWLCRTSMLCCAISMADSRASACQSAGQIATLQEARQKRTPDRPRRGSKYRRAGIAEMLVPSRHGGNDDQTRNHR